MSQSLEFKCPHCGHVEADAWELSDGDDQDCQCGSCGAELKYSTELVRYYDVRLVAAPKDETA